MRSRRRPTRNASHATGVGWVLRELSTTAPAEATATLDAYRPSMSAEALRTATARLPLQ